MLWAARINPRPHYSSRVFTVHPRPRTTRVFVGTMDKTKYVVVSGGVISGVGKGIIASSAGLLLRTLGIRVTTVKIDPYLNVDAGTMNPKEHGECFVLSDGSEVDLDLGNYERYVAHRSLACNWLTATDTSVSTSHETTTSPPERCISSLSSRNGKVTTSARPSR